MVPTWGHGAAFRRRREGEEGENPETIVARAGKLAPLGVRERSLVERSLAFFAVQRLG